MSQMKSLFHIALHGNLYSLILDFPSNTHVHNNDIVSHLEKSRTYYASPYFMTDFKKCHTQKYSSVACRVLLIIYNKRKQLNKQGDHDSQTLDYQQNKTYEQVKILRLSVTYLQVYKVKYTTMSYKNVVAGTGTSLLAKGFWCTPLPKWRGWKTNGQQRWYCNKQSQQLNLWINIVLYSVLTLLLFQ